MGITEFRHVVIESGVRWICVDVDEMGIVSVRNESSQFESSRKFLKGDILFEASGCLFMFPKTPNACFHEFKRQMTGCGRGRNRFFCAHFDERRLRSLDGVDGVSIYGVCCFKEWSTWKAFWVEKRMYVDVFEDKASKEVVHKEAY